MSLRSDFASGIITGVFGVLMTLFAGFALLIIALQRAMLGMMPVRPGERHGIDVMKVADTIHGIWFFYMPLTLVGGLVFAISGYYLYRGSNVARRVAQLNAICGFAWTVAYAISCGQASEIQAELMSMPAPMVALNRWFTIIATIVFGSLFPGALLIVLIRPKGPKA
ncbi:hypothetical protein ETAA8_34470 [Anatilimnocola aggregata]|uniref:DUF2269 family protein n=1 Tax=Anatilimnocola aggregata TaxID=2528021 RepID=A0A517YDN2_9BACT|nr:hypothetical protein [Anatilimnocola aggregata]QDU28347.1 hypothetical protein ETAA8_34470 [Anatilimnocola aggregata]